jgi:hypothetical protein
METRMVCFRPKRASQRTILTSVKERTGFHRVILYLFVWSYVHVAGLQRPFVCLFS